MFPHPLRALTSGWSRQCISIQASVCGVATASSSMEEHSYASKVVHGRGICPAYYHPRTHNIPVAVVQFRSYTPKLLDLFTHFATHAASSFAIPVSRPVYLPTQRSLWTVPKGPFAHKKAQENFERKVHKRVIKAWDADSLVVDRWLKYLQRHILAGVGVRSTKWERVPVGIGEHMLIDATGKMQLDSVSDAEKVKVLGDKIAREESQEKARKNAVLQLPTY